MQSVFSFALPTVTWQPPIVSELPSWRDAKRVAIDFETRDDRLTTLGSGARRGGHIVGCAFAIEDGPAHYLPIRHEGGDNLNCDHVLVYLKDQAACFRGELVGNDLQYEYDYAEAAGIHFEPKMWRDIQVAAPLLDELQTNYNMNAIADRLSLAGKDETALRHAAQAYGLHPKKQLWKLPGRYVANYGIGDVRLPLEILRRQEREIDHQDLWKVYDLESEVLPILAEIRQRGIPINLDAVDQLDREAITVVDECMAQFSTITGIQCTAADVNRPRALEPALREVGIHVPYTRPTTAHPSGQPSVSKELFARYLDPNEKPLAHVTGAQADAIRTLARARRWSTLRSTCKSRHEHAVFDGHVWRIHPTFRQLRSTEEQEGPGDPASKGARFGRMSSTDPNAQQEHVRDPEFGLRWRAIYMAEDGEEFISQDFSQQEPRICVHYAEWMGFPGAKEFADKYRFDPTFDFHNETSALTGIERDRFAKPLGLGRIYNMGGAKFCDSVGLPTEYREVRGETRRMAGPEGQAMLDKFDAGVPFVRLFSSFATRRAETKGYLILADADKRRIRFPRDAMGNVEWGYKALNRIVQGRAAHQTKRALVALHRAGFPIRIPVHDEFCWSSPSRARAVEGAIVMREADPLRVPNKVTLKVGPNWGNLEKIPVPMEKAA